MSRFADLTLTWKGRDYIVKAGDMLGLIEVVEEIVTLPELERVSKRFQKAKLARAYGAMLRYAGCHVDDVEVHDEMFSIDATDMQTMQDAIAFLYRVVTPPSWIAEKKSAPKKKSKKKRRRKAS